jgi:hypothetical protein
MGGFIMTGYQPLDCFFSKGFFLKEKFDANGKRYDDWIPSVRSEQNQEERKMATITIKKKTIWKF